MLKKGVLKMLKPVRNDDALYRTVDQVIKETNLCRQTVMRIAEEAESVLRIGRSVRINTVKLYDYMEKEYKA